MSDLRPPCCGTRTLALVDPAGRREPVPTNCDLISDSSCSSVDDRGALWGSDQEVVRVVMR